MEAPPLRLDQSLLPNKTITLRRKPLIAVSDYLRLKLLGYIRSLGLLLGSLCTQLRIADKSSLPVPTAFLSRYSCSADAHPACA